MRKAHRPDIGPGDQAADADLGALLSGRALTLGADPVPVDLAASLAALTEASAPDQDLPARVRDAYRDAFAMSNPSKSFARESAGRRPMLRSLLNAKAAAVAVAAGGLSLGGLTAAYAGALPEPAQTLAHHAIGAPAANPHQPAGKPVGPDASGHAAYGLCTAWQHAHDRGKASNAPAFRNLIATAGGADQVDTYCAAVFARGHGHAPTSPGKSAQAKRRHGNHPTGKPSAMPTQAATNHPTGKPSAMPTQAATDHPAGKPGSGPTQGHGDRSHAGSRGGSSH